VSVNKVSRWKKQVSHYLNVLEKCKVYEIRFDQNFFTVNIDGEKETSEWKDFEYFDSIMDLFQLKENTVICFPKINE
jgi:ribosome maturation protein Sdo1